MADSGALKAPKTAAYEQAGATFLSKQPPTFDYEHEKPKEYWLTLRNHLEQRLTSLRTWRNSWWIQNWSDIALFVLPRRSIWLTQTAGGWPSPNNMNRGRPINTAIINPTGSYALRVCAAGLMSGLASPSRPWFKIIPAVRRVEIDAAARNWLDEIEDRMYTVIAASNFYNSFAQECEDLVAFGTGPSLMYDDKQDLIRLYNPTVGEYFLGADGTMRTDAFYRAFLFNIDQAISFFGAEKTPETMRKLWQQKGSQLQNERIIGHSIEPNFGIGGTDAGKLDGNYTWREVYWLFGTDSIEPFSIRGFNDAPFTAACWSRQSNDAYGRSVGMDVLPDIMQLQVMERRKAEAIEKQVRPPLVADMSLRNQPSSTLPGHVTYVSQLGPQTGMRPIYQVEPDLQWMAANIKDIEQRIKIGFFNDLFLMLEQMQGQKMTAYEVAQKMQEKLQVLGPVIEGIITESLKPKLKRVFSVLKRKGFIDPPPPSLQGVPLDIQFVSILALAQKSAATGGMEALVKMIGGMSAVFPKARLLLNVDDYVREYNDLLGNPNKVLNGPEAVAKLQQAEEQQMKQQQTMQGLDAATKIAGQGADAAQTLAGTDIGAGQQALSSILGTERA